MKRQIGMQKEYRLSRVGFVALVTAGILASCASGEGTVDAISYRDETQAEHDARMQWWREARFGMFIHWGVYAVLGGNYKGQESAGVAEWIMRNLQIPKDEYEAVARRFNPVQYDPDAWVRLAKEAGMKYIAITRAYFLSDPDTPMKVEDQSITVPGLPPDSAATVVAVEIEGKLERSLSS